MDKTTALGMTVTIIACAVSYLIGKRKGVIETNLAWRGAIRTIFTICFDEHALEYLLKKAEALKDKGEAFNA